MKISIVNRVQNALTRMLVPFLIFVSYGVLAADIIEYYAIGLAVSSLLIFGFPLKINKSLDDLSVFVKNNEIFFIYLILSTVIIFYFVSIIFELKYLNFIWVGFYFILTHLYISLEKYCQYYDLEKKGLFLFSLHNLSIIIFICFSSFFKFDILFFFFGLFFISLILFLVSVFQFFNFEKVVFLDIKDFFEKSWILGQYSLMQNLINRGDSLILPYLFTPKVFANYYLITRFVDIGGFFISMFSQLSLINSFKNKKSPNLIEYIFVGIVAIILSIATLFAYTFFGELDFKLGYFLLFSVIILKALLLYFQDLSIYSSKEIFMSNALYIQFAILLILILFIDFFVDMFGVYFYFSYLIIMTLFSLFYLFFMFKKGEV